MKNSQKGFIIPLVIVVVVLVIGGGGVYFYSKNTKQQGQKNELKDVNVNVGAETYQNIDSYPSDSKSDTIISENELIIQGILNRKVLLLSQDVGKLRTYYQAYYVDEPKFAEQAKSADDKAILSMAALAVRVYEKIDGSFLRANCKFTITGNTAKCSWNPSPSNTNYTESITVKKINGIWQ